MKLKYRPEIDGLRAIAVSVVILYHAQITFFGYNLFPGGFIGVDIFFVISGYLITSIILKELTQTGSFSFKNFYQRRISRLLPVLLVVILTTIPFAWIYINPINLIETLKSILYSLVFSSNFYFHYTGQEYADISSLFKPFLHTWSLSVEEQYYILFPLVLMFLFKSDKKYLIHIFILGFIISLGFADWTSKNNSSISFYFLHTRIWELLAGSILAYFEIKLGHRSKNLTLNQIFPSFGMLLLGHAILFFNEEMYHPSYITLSPVIGVGLIIWFSNKNELITKILSSKLFVGVGLISYSLYLWHYPIFSIARIGNLIQTDAINKIIIAIIILVLSIASYNFIEKPFRNKKKIFKTKFLIITSVYLFCLSSIFFTVNNKYLFFDKIFFEYNVIKNEQKYWKKCQVYEIADNNYCKIGSYDAKVFLIGDSHIIPLLNDLGKKLNEKKYELINLSQESKLYRRKLIDKKDDKRVNYLKNIKNSILIFGGYYQRESKNDLDLMLSQYLKDFELFSYNNNKIIFLTPIPEVDFSQYDLNLIFNNKKKEISVTKKDVINKNKLAINFIDKFHDISVIDLTDAFCDKIKCYAVKPNKIILKSDTDHPSLKGAEMINDLIMKEIEKIKFN